MSTSDTKMKSDKSRNIKTSIVYLFVSLFAFIVNKVYALFGHGVSSDAMTWMFLYPLIGGALWFFLIVVAFPRIRKIYGYRLFFNLYNSGIAALTVGSFLQGVVEIAGTNSPYIVQYFRVGWLCATLSLIVFLILAAMQFKRTEA